MGVNDMCDRADGLGPFDFKSPYVSVTWVLGAVGCFGTMLVMDLGFVKGAEEAFAVLPIKVNAPVSLPWLAYFFPHTWSKFLGKPLLTPTPGANRKTSLIAPC